MTSLSPCILCGSQREPWLNMPLDAKTFEPMSFGAVARCSSCGLSGVDPMPSVRDVPSFYQLGSYYTQGESHFPPGDSLTLLDRIRLHLAWRFDQSEHFSPERMVARAGVPEGGSILDIGCGDGSWIHAVESQGYRIVGLDPDPEAVERGRQAGRDIRQGVAEEADSLLASEPSFDMVMMTHALEHCIDPVAVVRAVRKLTKKGGVFVCEVPNCSALHFLNFNIASEMFDAPRHLWFFEPRALKRLLEESGFVADDEYYYGYARFFANDWRATEIRIRDRLIESGKSSSKLPPAHSRTESMRLLFRTALASRDKKYDSLGFFARCPEK